MMIQIIQIQNMEKSTLMEINTLMYFNNKFINFE